MAVDLSNPHGRAGGGAGTISRQSAQAGARKPPPIGPGQAIPGRRQDRFEPVSEQRLQYSPPDDQFVEGNVLSPMIVGDRIRLHPVWLMFALFAFGYLFGFVGMLLAVPAAAAIGVLVRFGLHAYLQSPLYSGETKAGSKRG